ncbi:MAG: hypothetical protein H0U23_02170, partial [Blastocatellia bacterium]|nr:hypothetical protein [Blastocatellia bacterium]
DNVGIKCLAKIGTDRLVVGTSFGTVELVELAEPKRRSVCYTVQPAGRAVRSFAWHDKSGLLAVGTNFGTIHIVSPRADWSCICQLSGHTDAATGLAWSASGDRLASVSWDRTLRMWDIGTQKEIWRSPEQSYDSGSLSLSWELAEDEVLTTWNESQEGGKVRVWNAATGEPVRGFGEAEPFFKSIAGSRSRKLLAVSASGKIQMYVPDIRGVHILPPNSHAGKVLKADICYPRAEVATLGSDGIRVWSAESGHWLKSPQACPDWSRYGNSDHFITYSLDGNSLACVVGKKICMFEAETLDLRWTRSVEGRGVERCTFSNDSELFFTDDGGSPRPEQYEKLGSGGMLWNVQTGQSDQSGDGIRAEKYLNSRNRSGTAVEAVHPNWEGGLSKGTETGFTNLRVKDDSGCESHYRVSRVVFWGRKLKAFGEWIVLFKGARAPSKLCIVRPTNLR